MKLTLNSFLDTWYILHQNGADVSVTSQFLPGYL